ncbi:DUF899 family protein [Actinosynnema sp. NPDC059335]|uniref:DUF899 family protein n=1 Tax=Actinosynnema sp. NPDC059335 TaxID=3346804 RepID=UPI00366FC860
MSGTHDQPVLPIWPAGASPEYQAARMELARAERRLRDEVEAVAAARRAMPPGPVLRDYELTEDGPGGPVRTRLRDLFGEHDTMFIYHLMFHPDHAEACPMCSMWVDALRGVATHLAQHTAFVVIGKAPLEKLRAWSDRRGWDGLRILSSHGTTFNADLNAERANGDQRPMVSVLRAEGDAVRHFYSLPANHFDGTERGIDLLNPVWNVLDLLPGGRGDWYADNDYVPQGGSTRLVTSSST